MTNQKQIETLAKKLWAENEEVATELANVIFGIRDGDYEEEFEYPIYKKSINTGSISRFTSLTTREIIIKANSSFEIGTVSTTSVPHTDTNIWKDVPYDRERGLFHGQPVYAWDNNGTHQRAMAFYDAKNMCLFTRRGQTNGYMWDNYEAIPTEHIPEWMYEQYKTLEGI